jgi:hypothetical protein
MGDWEYVSTQYRCHRLCQVPPGVWLELKVA